MTLTAGREVFPNKHDEGCFEVGPISVTVSVKAGEFPSDVYLRARQLLEAVFRAEFEIKSRNYKQRLEEATAG